MIGDPGSSGGLANGVNGNLVGVDPLLGPLADNGGPTKTMALLPGSPAINAGNNPIVIGTLYDQRGDGFDRLVGLVDIGAFELQNQPPVGTPPTLSSPGDQSVVTGFELAITLSGYDPDVDDTLTYTIATGLRTGMTLDPDTGEFAWTPDTNDLGTHDITFRVTDAAGEFDEKTVTLTVLEPGFTVEAYSTYAYVLGSSADNAITVTRKAGDPTILVVTDGTTTEEISTDGQSYFSLYVYGGAGHDTLTASEANGTFVGLGTSANPTIYVSLYGEGGNDTLTAGDGGAYQLYGGSGDDTLTVGDGNGNTLAGGDGNDSLTAGDGDYNTLYGEEYFGSSLANGDDTLTVGNGNNNALYGDAAYLNQTGVAGGNDVLTVGNGSGNNLYGDGYSGTDADGGHDALTAGSGGNNNLYGDFQFGTADPAATTVSPSAAETTTPSTAAAVPTSSTVELGSTTRTRSSMPMPL